MDPSPPLPPELRSALTILDALDEGVLLVDRKNRVAWINRPLASLFGLDRNALSGIDLDLFVRRYISPCMAEEGITAPFLDRQGEGLGLFIVRTLVARYGRKVSVEDRVPGHPKRGAAFRFALKRAA